MHKSHLLLGLALCTALGCGGGSGSPSDGDDLELGDVVARDATGAAQRLGETVVTEGVAIVDAGLFANNKLKLFVQANGDGAMVFHATSAAVPAFVEGDVVRATGVVAQSDPTAETNRVVGTVLVDITDGSIEILAQGEPLPEPANLTIAEVTAVGDGFVGTLVRLAGVRKTAGDWPEPGSRSAEVGISDASSTNDVVLRFQRRTIDDELIGELAAIGDGEFDLVGVLVQDDTNEDGDLLDGYEIWPRGARDVAAR